MASSGSTTITVTFTLLVVAPEVPVTTSVELPTGVVRVVAIVRLDVAVGVTVPGEKVQVAAVGQEEAERATVPVPLIKVTVIVVVALNPFIT